MKIMLLASAASIHTVKWANALVSLGHTVDILTMHSSNLDQIDNRVTVYCLPIENKLGYYLNAVQANRVIRKIKPDIINTHYASGYGTLSRLVNFSPTLLSIWGSDVYLYPHKSKWNKKILIKNLNSANQIASTSMAMKQQAEHFFEPNLPIAITPFGVDLTVFKPSNKQLEDITIGTVKKLEYIYGIDILIDVFSRVRNRLQSEEKWSVLKKLKLRIIGTGNEKENLIKLAREKNVIDYTEFIDAVPNREVPNLLNQIDVFCAFSRSESFGVSVLEASSCEIPVVVSDVGGLPEVVQDEKTGFIVYNNDIETAVDKLYNLVLNKQLRRKMGRNGRQFVEENYDWNENVVKMVEVYQNLINNKLN